MIHSPEALASQDGQPSLISRLLDEQRKVLATTGGQLTFEALSSMPLLDNCMKETLRLFPPLIILMRKAMVDVPIPGTDYVIPKGDLACICPVVQNRLPEHFKDPEKFNPDRFINTLDKDAPPGPGTDEVAFAPHRLVDELNKWIPFGGGRHACVGRYFAFLQVKSIASLFIRHFEMEWRDPRWISPRLSRPHPSVAHGSSTRSAKNRFTMSFS